ncbi:hypothetical protein Hte_012633 [Hypoxylon texense]
MTRSQYTRLNAAEEEIRLFTLLPGSHAAPLVGTISHVPLKTLAERKILRLNLEELEKTLPPGWTVGETHEGRYIRWKALNHSSYGKTDQKAEFRYRRVEISAWLCVLWVDAVCIDQGNIPERNTQVPRMSLIYKLAARVVLWAGPSADRSSLALARLKEMKQRVTRTKSRWWLPSPGALDFDQDGWNSWPHYGHWSCLGIMSLSAWSWQGQQDPSDGCGCKL